MTQTEGIFLTTPDTEGTWQAALKVEFDFPTPATKTRLRSVRHKGPLRIQKPFYPETDGTCHVYILHPPGGLVAGDELTIHVSAENDSRCVLTTPGATKCYRCDSGDVTVTQQIDVGSRAFCEWLPQETILFDGARLRQNTRIHVESTSKLVAWDTIVLGRIAAGESFNHGRFQQRLEIFREGVPLLCERMDLRAQSPELKEIWGLSSLPVVSTLYFVHTEEALHESLLDDVREASLECDEFAGTHFNGLSIYRYLGSSTEKARNLTETVWSMYRNRIGRNHGHRPRIWQT